MGSTWSAMTNIVGIVRPRLAASSASMPCFLRNTPNIRLPPARTSQPRNFALALADCSKPDASKRTVERPALRVRHTAAPPSPP